MTVMYLRDMYEYVRHERRTCAPSVMDRIKIEGGLVGQEVILSYKVGRVFFTFKT